MIETIVFDYGGVITTQKRSKLISKWAEEKFGADREKVYKVFNAKEWAHAYSKGAITQAQFYQHVIDECGLPCTIEELSAQFASYNAPDKDMENLVLQLAKQVDLCLISDSMPELTADIKNRFGNVFRVAVFSDEEKCLKDEGKLFEIGFLKISTPGPNCIYIDDRPEKLEYPKSIGVTTIHFQNYEQLRAELFKLIPELQI